MYIISVIIIIYLLRRGVLLPKGVISVNINIFKPVIHYVQKNMTKYMTRGDQRAGYIVKGWYHNC